MIRGRLSSLWVLASLASTVLGISACQHEVQCEITVAATMGRQAASNGQKVDPGEQYSVCPLAWKQAWQQGWREGQQALCQAGEGWRRANAGEPAHGICDAADNRPGTYAAAYRLGEQLRELEQEAVELATAAASPTGLDGSAAARQRSLEHEISALRALAQQQGFLEYQGETQKQ